MSDPLVGARVTAVRPMTAAELEAECWSTRIGGQPVAIDFDDGTTLYPACDPEGNGPGALFGTADGELIVLNGTEAP